MALIWMRRGEIIDPAMLAEKLTRLRDLLTEAVTESVDSPLWISVPLTHSLNEVAHAVAVHGEVPSEAAVTIIARAQMALDVWFQWCAENGRTVGKQTARITRLG